MHLPSHASRLLVHCRLLNRGALSLRSPIPVVVTSE